MKRTVKIFAVAVVALIGFATVSYAQPRSVGANLGGHLGLSYQHSLGTNNMVDLDVSVPLLGNVWGLSGTCTYDWIDPGNTPVPWNNKGEWHWYAGVGGAVGSYDFKSFFVGVAGHIGIEYDFWFPLQLSLDYRPSIGISNYADSKTGWFDANGFYGISLGVRYKF
ncbi:MAG: hypothetical protein ACI30B_00845 [Paludibacteraceae bacterium]